jgi:AraC-like DNA-binding protein
VEDLVREGLKCLQLSGAIFLRAYLTAPWCYESPEPETLEAVLRPGGRRIILFHVFTEGQCRLRIDHGGEIELVAGDIVILPFANKHHVGDPGIAHPVDLAGMLPPPPWPVLPVIRFGGGGAPTSLVCGYLLSDDAPLNPVLASLPPLIRVRGSQGPLARWVEASVQYALHASGGRDPERDPLLKRLPELLFMECLCEHVRQQPESRGWLAALADPIVGRALGCMHQRPQYPWTLHELARRAASSRSTLDERFRTLLGRAPMNYLIGWRLQRASRQLRTTNASLIEIAEAVGYGSEASFSRAFKRHTGVSPSEWRQLGQASR